MFLSAKIGKYFNEHFCQVIKCQSWLYLLNSAYFNDHTAKVMEFDNVLMATFFTCFPKVSASAH